MSPTDPAPVQSSLFQRLLLPAFAFKAVVIGGGYATGRELAEFFLPSGPWGGLLGMGLAAVIWSLVCAVTFLFAWTTHSADYRTFFGHLLGRFSISFEIAYALCALLLLAVFGAAAGAIGAALLDWPTFGGTLVLLVLIIAFVSFGNAAVERLFKYVSIFLYATYAIFLLLCLSKFGGRTWGNLAHPTVNGEGWMLGGVTYAGYNIVCAVVILPVLRHFRSRRDAVIAGLICGPMAMLPAVCFFICMVAYYPEIATAVLPSEMLLRRLDLPVFELAFQLMIFAALLEGGTGHVHAINERIARVWLVRRQQPLPQRARLLIAAAVLIAANFLAGRFGLIELIAKGYRGLSWVFLGIYVLPVMTVGLWRLTRPAAPDRVGLIAD
jgi:uncharacterized membrane protein YkvI